MEEWKNFKTGQEMADACQIPPCVLEKMTTQALIQAIWEYPTITGMVIASSSSQYQWSYDTYYSKNYNVFMELERRKDAGDALFKRIVLADHEAGVLCIWLTEILELIIAQDVFLSQLNYNQKRALVEICVINDGLREGVVTLGRSIAKLLIGRILVSIGYDPFIRAIVEDKEFEYFLKGYRPNAIGVLTGFSYNNPAYQYIQQQIIRSGIQFLTTQ